MVVAAHPLAAQAGAEILERGGSAVDAAIAVQMVLTLVEPQSSGIGGGGFMLVWDAERRRLAGYDGRETAPAAARPDRFLQDDGTPLPFMTAVTSGKSIGVPGILRMLALAHERHGRLPWPQLFEPAIRLSESGFVTSPRLRALLQQDPHLSRREPARSTFYRADGQPKTYLENPALAATLRGIAAGGAAAFYHGLAPAIAEAVAAAGGDMATSDLANYRAKERAPLCAPYRQWRVCGMPPPTAGGIAVLQMLGLVERFDLGAVDAKSAEMAHLLAEAGRLAFADRNRYVADPDAVAVPTTALLDRSYLDTRSLLIRRERAMEDALPGDLRERHGWGDDATLGQPSTSHVSIVDAEGNAVALTSSVENAFGSRIMVGGFLLNNQLTDFSFRPEVDGRPVANAVAPGKRPRSSMAPTMVFDADGGLRLITGSAGGSRIIGYVARTITGVLDNELSPQDAAALPHVVNRDGATEIEDGPGAPRLRRALEALGHTVDLAPMTSGTHSIGMRDHLLEGGADPRREGIAVGR